VSLTGVPVPALAPVDPLLSFLLIIALALPAGVALAVDWHIRRR
jgi:hypothetical protein